MKLATDHKGNLRSFFSPDKVSQALGVHKRTVLRMIERRELRAHSIRPGVLRIPDYELERLLAGRTVGSGS